MSNSDPTESLTTLKFKLPAGIWALGFVSLLMDISSEMVHGLLPVFLVTVLGSSYAAVGFIEGFGEAAAVAMKVLSGPFSDWIQKRKPLVFAGYLMGMLSKPLFALAGSANMVFGARVFDRIGKGIRGAPRDALIADLAPPRVRGAAFGLRQSLDTIGAVLGPLFAIGIMTYSDNNYRLVFWLAVIPGVLCVLLILFGIREPEKKRHENRAGILQGIGTFKKAFWMVALAGGISQLARFSEAFLILRATNLGLPLSLAPVVLVAMNIIYTLSAYPIGAFSDRWSRKKLVVIGFFVLAVADLFLALSSTLTGIFIGILIWGLHMGMTQGNLAALVADHCPEEFRGTAFGLFNLFTAVALFIASATAGLVWDQLGPQFTFLIGAGISLLGGLLLLLAKKRA